MKELLGILISILFVFLIIGLSTLFMKLKWLSLEGSRKFIHILVGNWWFIAMYYFDTPFYAMLVPLLFVVVNYVSYKKQLFKAMERDGSKSDLGTVYYAISLLLLALIYFNKVNGMNIEYIGGLGILTMAYGDGFAAIVGKAYGKNIFVLNKTIEGSITMFICSIIPLFLILSFYSPFSWIMNSILSIALAGVAVIFEAYTKNGFDNLSVPLGISFIYSIILFLFI